jgi:DNA-binding NarL/FixJ family response regulator
MKQIQVLLIDDEAAVLRGLRMRLALEPDIHVVGEATGGSMGIDLANHLNPDVVLMDVSMPAMDGIAAIRELSGRGSCAAVVVLSLHDDAGTVGRALDAGAFAFVAKHQVDSDLLAAIRMAAEARKGEALGNGTETRGIFQKYEA